MNEMYGWMKGKTEESANERQALASDTTWGGPHHKLIIQ